MKQEAAKKNKKWIWLAAVLAALLAAAGVALAFMLPGQQAQPGSVDGRPELYWNIDRVFYTENSETGLSTREAGEDGLYHVRFAYEGEQVELTVANDRQLINYMDTLDAMGLVRDADGLVVDVVDPTAIATEVAKNFFVKEIRDDTIVANSSRAMNGMDITLALTDCTGIYDVSSNGETVGQISQCDLLDEIVAYADAEGQVTHVYIVERAVEAEVYYRVGYHYEWYEKHTTRVPDENGVYTMLFSYKGEHVELKCRDYNLVDEIDSYDNSEADFAFLFDKEGYIIGKVDVAIALKGKEGCYNYDITELNGNTFAAQRFISGRDVGKTFTATLDESCQMYLVCSGGTAQYVGQPITELQLGDRIICYTDLQGKPILIFVTKRMVDSPMYYNISRKYANGATTRTPDSKGWYIFDMTVGGKQVTLKTKDKDVASRVDSFSSQCMGLKVSGDVIEAAYDASCVCGWGMVGQGRYVTALNGTVGTFTSSSDFDTFSNLLLSPDCEIYDVTWNHGVELGQKTTLQMYDQVTAYRNREGQVSHIYITQRYVENAKIYYSIERKYANNATSRIADENGYYVYDMICEGKQVTLKTKSKSIASYIDKQWPNFVALEVSGDVIKQAYKASSALQYGGVVSTYQYIDRINWEDRTFTTYYYETGNVWTQGYGIKTMAKDCVVYNVSSAYTSHRGEKATLKPDDIIQGFKTNPKGEVEQIFILSRKFDSPLYWNTEQKYNWTKKETTRVPDGNGYYVFDLMVNGTVKQVRTKDKSVATSIDAKETAFALVLSGDQIVRVGGAALAKGIQAEAAVSYDVMSISGKTATLTKNRPAAATTGDTKQLKFASNCKYYDVSSYAEKRGAATKLSVGDRVTCYTDIQGEVVACFITYKNTHAAGAFSHCDHCDKDVLWQPYTGNVYAANAHYYLTHDRVASGQASVGNTEAQYDVVLDLNGHTLTANKRAFLVYGTLSIVDTAGGGIIATKNGDGSYGGCIMATASGTLNLYGGTLTMTEDASFGRLGGMLNFSGYNTVFNMYGGTVCGGTVRTNDGGFPYGGNIYVSGGTVNLYGGKITGGTVICDGITAPRGNNIYLTGKLNLLGGVIDGDVAVSGASSKVTVSGAPVVNKGKVTGLQLPAGATLTVGELTKGASVAITGNGLFAETDKAADYAGYFKATGAGDQIVAEGNALYYVAADKAVDNSALTVDPQTARAVCPVCNESVVWTALTRQNYSNVIYQLGSHYYLTEDLTSDSSTAPAIKIPTWKAAGGETNNGLPICLHLNGHNITANRQYAISNSYGGATVNVMGEGTVSGNNTTANRGSTVFVNTENTLALNLYGGTYVKPSGNSNPIVCVGNWDEESTVNIYTGATVNGNATVYKGSVHLSGGKLLGELTVSETGKLTVSGATGISKLTLVEGVKIKLGELSEGAAITVSASGVFTEVSQKAADYAVYFKPAIEIDQIVEENGALCYKKADVGNIKFTNDNLEFFAGTSQAACPVCLKVVQWTAIDMENYASYNGTNGYMQGGTHYYLAEDITTSGVAFKIPTWSQAGGAAADGKHICLHLNGKNITSTDNYAIQNNYGGATVNVMGSGIVSGNCTTEGRASTVFVNAENTLALNLYGGTYKKPEGNANAIVLVGIWNKQSTMGIYGNAVIDGEVVNSLGTLNLGGDAVINGQPVTQ